MNERLREITAIWTMNQWLYIVSGFIAGILLFPFLSLINSDVFGFVQDLVPEFFGIVFTVFLVDRIYKYREEETYKRRLIRLMSSRINNIAIRATEELRAHRWLKDGSLRTADLTGANLNNASLVNSDVRGVIFKQSNLRDARFKNAKYDRDTILPDGSVIQSSSDWDRFTDTNHPDFWIGYEVTNENYSDRDLQGANLRGADLWGTDFRNANLAHADLSVAELSYTDLRGANLAKANLQGCILRETKFDEQTILPDGSEWKPNVDVFSKFGCSLWTPNSQ